MEKATFTLLNWFHISPQVVFIRISISSLSFWEAARSLCERRMLSSVNRDHESGSESLGERKTSVFSHRPRTHQGKNLLSILELLYVSIHNTQTVAFSLAWRAC